MTPVTLVRGLPHRIAVIEDDDSVRRAVSNLLSSLGFEVTTYVSAEDFLNSPSEPLICLVLDIKLPGMSGLELLARLRSMRLETEVVVLTARGTEEARKRAFSLRAEAFLTKPFRSDDLLRAVRAAIDRS